MTSGEDFLTANLVQELEEMEEDSFSSALIPLVKSASVRGNLIQLNLERRNPGAKEFIRMREVPPDGRTAGGLRSVDNYTTKGFINNFVAWIGAMLVVVFIFGFAVFLIACWVWVLIGAFRLMF